jgi:16S rRNA (uracil1498-N3)-methyltransferase
MVDMLTQLGVGRIIPLQCDRSITKFNSAHRQKWQRVAVEACKQAQNPWVPQIDELQTIEQVLGEKNGLKLFADKDGRALSTINVIEPLTCLVGPEGGFSPNEYAKFAKNGVESAGLSKHILRIELAAITMMTQATAVNDV